MKKSQLTHVARLPQIDEQGKVFFTISLCHGNISQIQFQKYVTSQDNMTLKTCTMSAQQTIKGCRKKRRGFVALVSQKQTIKTVFCNY